MQSDEFRMNNGGGVHTRLWRHQIIRRHWTKYEWRDAPPGEKWDIRFDDIAGRPCDDFGLPLSGDFVEHVKKYS